MNSVPKDVTGGASGSPASHDMPSPISSSSWIFIPSKGFSRIFFLEGERFLLPFFIYQFCRTMCSAARLVNSRFSSYQVYYHVVMHHEVSSQIDAIFHGVNFFAISQGKRLALAYARPDLWSIYVKPSQSPTCCALQCYFNAIVLNQLKHWILLDLSNAKSCGLDYLLRCDTKPLANKQFSELAGRE